MPFKLLPSVTSSALPSSAIARLITLAILVVLIIIIVITVSSSISTLLLA